MNDDAPSSSPPELPESGSETPPDTINEPVVRSAVPAWRWWIHLLILTAYPLMIAFLSDYMRKQFPEETGAALPADLFQLGFLIAETLFVFAIFFGLAWLASRVTREQLWMKWESPLKTIGLSFLYSIGLRIVMAGAVMVLILGWVAYLMATSDTSGQSLQTVMEEELEQFRPKTEHLVDTNAIVESPGYLLINSTLVSFVVAGFREELWRAGMLAGMIALFPRFFGGRIGPYLAVMIAAVIFGLGHWLQGIGGMLLTGLLGVLLGVIMVVHRNIWYAVLAHGFFDASTFVMMFILGKYGRHLEGMDKLFGP